MASVYLDFLPPEEPIYDKLLIFEAATEQDAPGALIETVIFTVGNYPTRHTTTAASSSSGWFSIQWESPEGVKSPMSYPVQGGTQTLVGQITSRVMLRDPTLNENVVAQEAEAAIADYFDVDDPYTIETAIPQVKSGLTLLVLARTNLQTFISTAAGSADSFTAGLVSIKSESSSGGQERSLSMIKEFLDEAERILGRKFSIILQIEDLDVAGGLVGISSIDQSRLLLEVQ